VSTANDTQTVTLTALGGYQPSLTQAVGGIPTKLIIDTKNTFDCSASLTIPGLGVNRLLPPNGQTEVDLGTPVSGSEIFGTCTMGMYSFRIKFS
jgi:plastocyanin domain-containing protein